MLYRKLERKRRWKHVKKNKTGSGLCHVSSAFVGRDFGSCKSRVMDSTPADRMAGASRDNVKSGLQ